MRFRRGPQGVTIRGNTRNVRVGPNVSFGGDVMLFASAPIEIGEHTMIGYGSIIHTSTHDHRNHPMWKQRIDRPIHIGAHVWIGTGAIILPGVKVGDNAVIASGSVVNAHVPEGAIVAGNPARIVKYRNLESLDRAAPVPDYPIGASIRTDSFLDDSIVCKARS